MNVSVPVSNFNITMCASTSSILGQCLGDHVEEEGLDSHDFWEDGEQR